MFTTTMRPSQAAVAGRRRRPLWTVYPSYIVTVSSAVLMEIRCRLARATLLTNLLSIFRGPAVRRT